MITQDRDPAPDQPGSTGWSWAAKLGLLRRPGRARTVTYWCAGLVLLVAAALIVTVVAAPAKKAAPPPKLAKSFSVPELGHAGITVSLAAYAGRPVIVNFFASWCVPCRQETPMLAHFYASQHGRVVLLGIDANDETPAALRFTAKAGVRYPVGSDPFPSPVTTSYGVYALPQTFFLNAQHRIVFKVIGAVTSSKLARGVALMNQDRG
jgi:cytochrome c biogenesis protein CcmG, thiol:disulfide interchange protein DsbE